MSDISQTATAVVQGANALTTTGIAGATIAAGDLLYVSSGTLFPALNDTALHAAVVGMALNGGAVTQTITYQTGGRVNPGGTVAVAVIYGVSVNAGKVAPSADLGSGKFRSIFGYGVSTTLIEIHIVNTGFALA